ncbi:MAG: hypothetical protein UI647_08070 [Negativibacillus sp.]
MSSSNKTGYLGLNQFVGSDKPKMEDFNADNRLLDEKMQQHVQSQLHLTEQQKERLENLGYLIGSYTGDGTAKRTISVAQTIGFGFVFMVGEGLHYAVTTLGENHIFSAVMTPQGCSKGVSIASGGFTVLQSGNSTPDGKKNMLNQSGKKYIYLILPAL